MCIFLKKISIKLGISDILPTYVSVLVIIIMGKEARLPKKESLGN